MLTKFLEKENPKIKVFSLLERSAITKKLLLTYIDITRYLKTTPKAVQKLPFVVRINKGCHHLQITC